ncbi:MAG: amidohydrolase family protein, partial [Mycobacterium sp.]
HPARFSYFATLPLPDVEAAVREAIRTTDSGAAGIIVMSNASGQYLGDAALNPLWEHLNASPSDTLVAVRVAAHRGEHSVDPIPRTPFRFRRGPTTTRVRT